MTTLRDHFRHDSPARTALAIVGIWTLLCAAGALSSYADYARRGEAMSYATMLWRWWSAHIVMMLFSTGCYLALRARPGALSGAGAIALAYAAALVTVLPLELLYIGMLESTRKTGSLSLMAAWEAMLSMSRFGWFLEYAWLTFTFVAMVAFHVWRTGRARERALMQAHSDNLALRLELEEQRLVALRAQLEPHFIFNALNAISALVRSDDKPIALAGICHLSDLLRYALQASEHDAVSLADERQFLAGYLALQKMRYGERLQVSIGGDDDHVLAGEVPPLLLQPLIENALRHDLDCHDGSSDIRLHFARDGERLRIRICNPTGAQRSTNPGLGTGLRHSRARLQLAYGAAASLETSVRDGRFVVDIAMPRLAA